MVKLDGIVRWMAFALSFALVGCGGGKGSEAAKALNGVFGKAQTSNFQFRKLVQPSVSLLREEIIANAWLVRFQTEAGQVPALHPMTTNDPNLNCSGSNPDGTSASFTFSCTATADDAFTCGSKSYTLLSGGTFSFTGTYSSNVFAMTAALNSTISGDSFGTGTALSCNIAFSLNFAVLTAQTSKPFSADCTNVTASCTLGGTTISCDDMLDALNDSGNYCANN